MKDLFCKTVELHHFRDIQAPALPKPYELFLLAAIKAVTIPQRIRIHSIWLLKIGASFFGMLSALGLHHLCPAFTMTPQGPHHLRRGLVEGAFFGFRGAGFHGVSVA